MQFMALIYSNEEAWESASAAERESTLERYFDFADRGRESGTVQGGDELGPTDAATTVRVRGDETLVTDGPYAEVKEVLGGYFMLECDSIDEACELAAQIPAAERGAIEVRPTYVDTEGER